MTSLSRRKRNLIPPSSRHQWTARNNRNMSPLHTWRSVKPLLFQSVAIACLKLYRRNNIFRSKTGAPSLTLTCQTTRLLRMAETDSRVSSQSDCNDDVGFGSVDPAYCEIIVIRHGETEWNADGKCQGQLDVDLNEVGRQQAAAVADRLSRETKISVVYASDLKRALDTAQIIANSCGGLEVINDPDLRERHLGDLQGLVYRDFKLSPKAYQAFSSHRTDQEIPGGGESFDKLYQRCTSSLQRIGRKHKGERVVAVTHGAVIEALYKRASPNGRPGKVWNTSVNIFHLSDGDEWIIKSWGDISHLDQTGFLKSGFGGDGNSG